MELKELIEEIVDSPALHAKWLNTLSMMENTGARKISASEHPVLVNQIILKHAAEEARHAHYLKKQIAKIDAAACPTYEFQYLLSPIKSYQYLHALDVEASRMLKVQLSLSEYDLRFAAYLLVTYAIEVRADGLYPVYQEVLDNVKSAVNVKSIILEEEGHLEEMIKQLHRFSPQWHIYAEAICKEEKKLFNGWVASIGVTLKAAQLKREFSLTPFVNPDSTLFNVRVYGILIQDKNVLVTDEYHYETYITKFPGGGLQFGEGTIECLKREFREEMEMDIEVIRHFYTTDFFQTSAFNNRQQVISIYYIVAAKGPLVKQITIRKFDFEKAEGAQSFRWQEINSTLEKELTFPIDKRVGELLAEN